MSTSYLGLFIFINMNDNPLQNLKTIKYVLLKNIIVNILDYEIRLLFQIYSTFPHFTQILWKISILMNSRMNINELLD